MDQGVIGTPLTFTPIEYQDLSGGGGCANVFDLTVITDATMLSAHFNNNVPPELDSIDFAVDRLVLGTSNPEIEFAVDDGTGIVVGLEQLCQGIAPRCVGYVVHGATHDAVTPFNCPYGGPDPCLAP